MALTISEIKILLARADEAEFEAIERSLAADERKGVRSAIEVTRRRLAAQKAEERRLAGLYDFERSFLGGEDGVVVGLDEVGRGALAGPLAVGAVALPANPKISDLNDSKQLTAEHREAIAEQVKRVALAWAVVYISPEDIDRDGMTASLKRAFTTALAQVEQSGAKADVVLLDGNPLHMDERERNVLKGDARCASIAAASVVAKVERDALMRRLASDFPGYEFEHNKGYGSQQHIAAIKEHGMSAVHRRSFCRSFMQESLF